MIRSLEEQIILPCETAELVWYNLCSNITWYSCVCLAFGFEYMAIHYEMLRTYMMILVVVVAQRYEEGWSTHNTTSDYSPFLSQKEPWRNYTFSSEEHFFWLKKRRGKMTEVPSHPPRGHICLRRHYFHCRIGLDSGVFLGVFHDVLLCSKYTSSLHNLSSSLS